MTKVIEELNPELLLKLDAFLSEKDVMRVTTLSRTSLHRKRLVGEFPEPEPISEGRMGYRMRDVREWLQNPQSWSSQKNNFDI